MLLLLLLLNYLLTLEDSAKKTEKSKLGRNLNSRLIGPLSLLFRACSFSYFVNTSVSLVQLCTIRRIKIEKLFLLFLVCLAFSSYYFGFLVVFFRRLYQIMKPLIINAQAIKSNVHNSKFCCCATFFIPAAAFLVDMGYDVLELITDDCLSYTVCKLIK